MTTVLFILGWYVLGLIGCGIGIAVDWGRGKDITVQDVLLSFVLSVVGPLSSALAF